jgi:hypothetical protein
MNAHSETTGSHRPSRESVLSKAVIRASERLGIKGVDLAKILGLSQPTVSRLNKGLYELNSASKEWEFALLFVRMYRSLDSIVGNDEASRRWLRSENTGLSGIPLDLIHNTEGLVRVSHYLDASRGLN